MFAEECTQLEHLTQGCSLEFKLKLNDTSKGGGLIFKTCVFIEHSVANVICWLAYIKPWL